MKNMDILYTLHPLSVYVNTFYVMTYIFITKP